MSSPGGRGARASVVLERFSTSRLGSSYGGTHGARLHQHVYLVLCRKTNYSFVSASLSGDGRHTRPLKVTLELTNLCIESTVPSVLGRTPGLETDEVLVVYYLR